MRTTTIAFLALCVIAFWNSCGAVGSQEEKPGVAAKQELPPVDDATSQLVGELARHKLTTVGSWDVGDESPLTYLVRGGLSDGGLTVIDVKGNILYEMQGITVERIYTVTALRKRVRQLLFQYSEGGTDSYVQMLDFDGNRVVEKVESSDGNNSFAADIRIQPQFRSGVEPAREPFEIVLMDFGLASPAGGKAKVFRFDGNKYRLVGTFNRKQVDDCKERLLTGQ